MKKHAGTPLLFVAILLLQSCSTDTISENATVESFAKSIFSLLKKNDTEGYVRLHTPKQSDIKAMLSGIKTFINSPGISSNDKKRAEQNHSEYEKRFTVEYLSEKANEMKRMFKSVRKEAAASGLNWSKSEFVNYKGKTEPTRGLTQITIHFDVKSGPNTYKFELNECIKTSQGLTCVKGPIFHGK